ncbi:glycosyltransferase [Lutimaribacter sp. EGI FJ00015]|uniref:Glycosyltransferase n=1 Tax=Lutimaribacter degradans TaxID=2945989 RepID=A0ACC5ZWW7_9RHOB|nr:glycosyltransferase [Lutimaribacter sp. EGI FJ00013]MCM2562542.1 glycosyltransferase [Lutimaribacter sp. EGI FJ00013]MCO0613699.1 glycosyltransferase [Lutimaribacter sp. EGI FJ00015]MCO0636818.1 glycosyltransferase [Lutimaribacter sp. EGI FJ00014]
MNILFIHQNFPGQFKHLAPALARAGHNCVALTLRVKEPTTWQGVKVIPYKISRGSGQQVHPWLVDFETKVVRAEACFAVARELRDHGFTPDLIVAHPGWGESMFLRDVWPTARIGLYCELYHRSAWPHMHFDPEFDKGDPDAATLRIRMKNLNNLVHLPLCDMGISPTRFQADTFPPAFRERISVIHDGIHTDQVVPNAEARLELPDGSVVTRDDEVITFVNRNLEPYRGYHVFMRALPRLLKERPGARVLIVGGDEVSYGASPPKGQTWKQIFIDEVRGQISTADWARVHFLGRIPYDRFISLLQVSRVHVYLTYPFVLSWSLFEAMSAGAAIVASDTGPLHEAIEPGKTGTLVDFFDKEKLVEEVCALLDDADRRAAYGAAARAFVRANYDLETICLPRQMAWIDKLAACTAGETGD